jgi:hypothetical protein
MWFSPHTRLKSLFSLIIPAASHNTRVDVALFTHARGTLFSITTVTDAATFVLVANTVPFPFREIYFYHCVVPYWVGVCRTVVWQQHTCFCHVPLYTGFFSNVSAILKAVPVFNGCKWVGIGSNLTSDSSGLATTHVVLSCPSILSSSVTFQPW